MAEKKRTTTSTSPWDQKRSHRNAKASRQKLLHTIGQPRGTRLDTSKPITPRPGNISPTQPWLRDSKPILTGSQDSFSSTHPTHRAPAARLVIRYELRFGRFLPST